MSVLDELEKRWRGYAVRNVTLYLVTGQSLMLLLHSAGSLRLDSLALVADRVREGEYWRLASFLLMPPTTSVIWALFAWYIFYLMGTALEHHWGAFRYNVYLLVAAIATVAVSFITPSAESSNAYVGGSVFLAFAFLYPDFQLYIFFILPVKVKWLALITWIFYGMTLVIGPWLARLLVLASICNFLLFFAKDIVRKAKAGRRRMASQAQHMAVRGKAFHECAACGITDKTHPQMDFRYCSDCRPARGYCRDHIVGHEHVAE